MSPVRDVSSALELSRWDEEEFEVAVQRSPGMFWAASSGARVRSVAESSAQGAFSSLSGFRHRCIAWVHGMSSTGRASGHILSALAAHHKWAAVGPIAVHTELPLWVGALDIVVVCADDAGDIWAVDAISKARLRGAHVVVLTPHEGPVAEAMSDDCVSVADIPHAHQHPSLVRHIAVGLEVMRSVCPDIPDTLEIAHTVDEVVGRCAVQRTLATNPAKQLADTLTGSSCVWVHSHHIALEIHNWARHLLGASGVFTGSLSVAEAISAQSKGSLERSIDHVQDIFHDPFIDGDRRPSLSYLSVPITLSEEILEHHFSAFPDVHWVNSGKQSDSVTVAANPDTVKDVCAFLALIEIGAVYCSLLKDVM